MKKLAGLFALAALAGCSAQESRKAEEDTAAEMKKAREAVSAEVREDLAATKKTMDALRAGLAELDHDVASLYHAALDEAEEVHHGASATWSKATEATDDAWHGLSQEAKEAAGGVKKLARRIEALTGDAKDDFVREAGTVLDEIHQDVRALETKTAELDEEGHEDLSKLAAEFRKDWEATKKGLDKAQDATDDDWKDMRHDVNHGLLKLKAKVREAHEKLERG